jgi:hypothetical protein
MTILGWHCIRKPEQWQKPDREGRGKGLIQCQRAKTRNQRAHFRV